MVEEKIKQLVLRTHRSLREFCVANDLNYSTFMTLLKNGFESSKVETAIQVARALGLSCEILESDDLLDDYMKGRKIIQTERDPIVRDPILDREGFRELIMACKSLDPEDLSIVTRVAKALRDSETLSRRKMRAQKRMENLGEQDLNDSWLLEKRSDEKVRQNT